MTKKIVIFSRFGEISAALAQFFNLFELETKIVQKAEEISIVEVIRGRGKTGYFVVIALDKPYEWLKWIYQIRCVAKFRGPCVFISKEEMEELEPARYQQLFKGFMMMHQGYFSYFRLFDPLKQILVNDETTALRPSISYFRFRRMQRKIKGLYLPTKHGWGTY